MKCHQLFEATHSFDEPEARVALRRSSPQSTLANIAKQVRDLGDQGKYIYTM